MAKRRMLSKAVIRSDKFIDMPLSTQALYMHLGMEADDDGFIASAKMIQRSIGASDDDLKLLIVKGFLIPFESGVVVIAHWKKSNLIQKDRYNQTSYKDELEQLIVKDGVYILDTERIQNGSKMDTERIQNGYTGKVSIGKDRLDKEKEGVESSNYNNKNARAREGFVPPTLDEVRLFTSEHRLIVDPDRFFYYYQGKGWLVGGSKMEDWQATILGWDRKDRADGRNESGSSVRPKSGAYKNIGGVQV